MVPLDFDYIFHSIVDLLYIIISFATVRIVSRQDWRHHLCWANPAAAASILFGLNRLARDLHHYFGIGTASNANLTVALFENSGRLVLVYSGFMFWRTLRAIARQPTSPDPLAMTTSPGVWPPPPTINH